MAMFPRRERPNILNMNLASVAVSYTNPLNGDVFTSSGLSGSLWGIRQNATTYFLSPRVGDVSVNQGDLYTVGGGVATLGTYGEVPVWLCASAVTDAVQARFLVQPTYTNASTADVKVQWFMDTTQVLTLAAIVGGGYTSLVDAATWSTSHDVAFSNTTVTLALNEPAGTHHVTTIGTISAANMSGVPFIQADFQRFGGMGGDTALGNLCVESIWLEYK